MFIYVLPHIESLMMFQQGKRIHQEHHKTTYFHVSLDPPWLILSVMGVAAVVFWLVFQGGPLSKTATAAYYAAGEPTVVEQLQQATAAPTIGNSRPGQTCSPQAPRQLAASYLEGRLARCVTPALGMYISCSVYTCKLMAHSRVLHSWSIC